MADYKKPDFWQHKARKEGYPARSVYKLKEIDEKFSIFKTRINGQARILDIGAAPGSWSLFVLRSIFPKLGGKGFLAAADLSPLSREFDKGLFSNDNFFFVQGDITTPEVREALLSKGPYSAIISDAAPATTGNHTVDAARSFNLAEEVINYAELVLPDGRQMLAPGGNLAVKVFQGGDSTELLKRMKTLFTTAKTYKPTACRGESVETYFVGLGFLG
ncbi:MAG: RlmE family RNA methyltransferase [Treponema sp.]|jgi:23S rRNA (uridine2552-2'-O)-methyltransferase|nr:RlmE family RNA methyltransferase [Treponema sp.]